tara:strand:- start:245 stop:568 length:324 start_codon:yes stop_codon:yes gene_type:complete
MNTLTFNPSNWGDIDEVTATVTDLGYGDSRIIFQGEQFEFSKYSTNYGETGGKQYIVCDLSHEGRMIATACKDDWTNYWYAKESDGGLSREDHCPMVALLQVVANVM